MADARLRDLARWEQADLETQVRLLRERMRVGELSDERVRLAAYLGDEASQQASGEPSGRWEAPVEFVSELEPFGPEAGVRAALAFARYALERWGSEQACAPGALAVAERWIREGCPTAHHDEARALADACMSQAEVAPRDQAVALSAAGASARGVVEALDPSAARETFDLLRGQFRPVASDGLSWHARPVFDTLALEVRNVSLLGFEPGPVLAAMAADLLPWALGLRDPVAEREEPGLSA